MHVLSFCGMLLPSGQVAVPLMPMALYASFCPPLPFPSTVLLVPVSLYLSFAPLPFPLYSAAGPSISLPPLLPPSPCPLAVLLVPGIAAILFPILSTFALEQILVRALSSLIASAMLVLCTRIESGVLGAHFNGHLRPASALRPHTSSRTLIAASGAYRKPAS